jgi:hypothetical protein
MPECAIDGHTVVKEDQGDVKTLPGDPWLLAFALLHLRAGQVGLQMIRERLDNLC